MNKTILVGMLSLVFAFTPFISHAAFDTSLKYGAKGTAVVELQEFLIEGNYLAAGNNSGNFFSLTLKAVKAFQVANNLPSTGYFGPMSRKIASDLLAADLSASDSQEAVEVGSVNAPSNTNSADALNKQIEDLTKKVEEQNVKLGSIVTNTTKVAPAPVVPTVTPQSIELVETFAQEPNSVLPHGRYSFNVKVLGSDGKPMKVPITVQWPSDHDTPIDIGGKSLYSGGSENTTKTPVWDVIQFGPYVPTTPGTKTITFTSGNLTKTVAVEVK